MMDTKTKLLGLIGHPVDHSFSPIMHNTAIEDLGINYVYLAFDVSEENLKNVVSGAKALQITGFNVTIPHKINIMKYLDEIDEDAKAIGAVNTVKIENGKAIGYNTDGIGAKRTLEEKAGILIDKNILIIGSGGASRAVCFELAKDNNLTIINRNIEKAKILSEEFSKKLKKQKPINYGDLDLDIKNFDIILNTTPVGMHPNTNVDPVIPLKNIKKDAVVMDLIYNPIEPVFLKEAIKYGAKTINGLGMLVYQGAVSFEIWTGMKPDIYVMKKAINSKIRL
ncbi:shikimate dehydrogenase [Methanococcus maripaludis]|uniref:Shikimate dehydrogenase (NADP(+)) n=2 Tax=Methanococcus maripaludis TaxID=39152 RepID=AROE_METM7|nr:shikimate dehydrogenase [Methanococcus maripaludis]A6VFM7.1 RecName: Full=Shikimate dehydrogenase (NADP(+)); Short=SDH [Methanococcus maripaludis C7]MBA2861955.1 shikimate dehydrogenase [Methanococcus maripaludis]